MKENTINLSSSEEDDNIELKKKQGASEWKQTI
jgi:hypothetical protein